MSQLKTLGIVSDGSKKAAKVFEDIFPDFREIVADTPSKYISIFWNIYKNLPDGNKDLNGKIFEYLLATVFVREGIIPIYMNAKVAFVPNVNFDLMFYTSERGPICISAKTSLRERYKQADLEAIALKYVHRKALSFLVTMDEKEADKTKVKIKKGEIIGLENIILATSLEFDELISELKQYEFCLPPKVEVVTSNMIVTKDNVEKL